MSNIGGLIDVFPFFVMIFYHIYNHYQMIKCMTLQVIIGNEKLYPDEYRITRDFSTLWWRSSYDNLKDALCCCFRRDLITTKKKRLMSGLSRTLFSKAGLKKQQARKSQASAKPEVSLFGRQMEIMNICNEILDDRMDIKNYIQDSMDLQIIRGLLLKSRHKILMPLLSIELTKVKRDREKIQKKRSVAANSFMRNLNEYADELPVFDVGTAVKHLKKGLHKSEVEKLVDDFFLKFLPRDVLGLAVSDSDDDDDEYSPEGVIGKGLPTRKQTRFSKGVMQESKGADSGQLRANSSIKSVGVKAM